jgi:hypothetical protein
MNISMIRVLALFGLIATIGPLSAMAQDRVPFSVPFGFTVGAKSFPPGDYRITETVPDIIVLRTRDGHGLMVTLGHPGQPAKTDQPTLVFHRYGNRYFLSEVRLSNRGSVLPMSAGEKELIAARAEPKAREVVASSGR